ncbi:hypothetical protein ACLF8M_07515 [Helicobacter pylori]
MVYYENITAGRGALDSFANALNSQRFANLMLNETISNFSNNITRAGALYDEARIREDALKYQRMQDFYNNKRKDEAFELEKKQAELSLDFAKRQYKWLMKAKQSAKASAIADNNNAMKTPTTRTSALNTLSTPTKPKPKTITKEDSQAIYANPMFRF